MANPRILIVEDDLNWQELYSRSLRHTQYEIATARSVKTALTLLKEATFDVVITDLKMLGGTEEFSGFGVLEKAKKLNPEVQVIVITGYDSTDHALRAMGSGAYNYIIKKSDSDLRHKLALIVQSALDPKILPESDDMMGFDRIIGNSASMQALFEQITSAANSDLNVMIYGEPGTGKRLIAQTIHRRSRRKDGAFMVVDCGRLSDAVLGSELFGHEQGSLYGLDEVRPGKFERAKGGTIFLDSVGDLEVNLQNRLVGAICDGFVERMGGQEPIPLDVRVIASTDKDLGALLKAQRFTRRLFDALNELVIEVPPLRLRKDGHDIPALAMLFLRRHGEGRRVMFTDEAVKLLHHYNYPGNVLELESAVKNALAMTRGDVIGPEHLRPEIRTYVPPQPGQPKSVGEPKDPATILRVCPLNLGMCSKKDEILRLHDPRRVFVNISYSPQYKEYEKILRITLEKYGLVPILSKDHLETVALLCNVCKLIQTCQYAVTDVSIPGSNVLYELGLMHAIGLHSAILKERRADLPADIQGLLFLEYNQPDEMATKLSWWVESQIPEAKTLKEGPDPSLAPDLYLRLQTTLLKCGPFTTDHELGALFVDTRIIPWRNQLPQAVTPANRVRAVIDALYYQYSTSRENALVLLLRVLSDQAHIEDACRQQLAQLADELARTV